MKEVLEVLPHEFRDLVGENLSDLEEIRLRQGQVMSFLGKEGELFQQTRKIMEEDLDFVLAQASHYSLHTVQTQISQGFLTIPGGHRIGLCGSALMQEGECVGIQSLTSLSIRISREMKGISGDILKNLMKNGGFENTLLLAPPGKGKTTLLRDLIRSISAGECCSPHRIAVIDPRFEISGRNNDGFSYDLGSRTDVMVNCPRKIATTLLLRSMNPEILAVDEITACEDVEALLEVVGCGVKLLATAHGLERNDLKRRAVYGKLLEENVFQRLVTIENTDKGRCYQVEVL